MFDEKISQVRAWILSKNPQATNLNPSDDIIESRILDSLSFMDFIFFLEELSGSENLMATATVDSFRSLDAIRNNILDRSPQVSL